MLQNLLVWLFKLLLQGVVWIFILSIRWEGQTLYQHGHNIFVDNDLVVFCEDKLKGYVEYSEEVFEVARARMLSKDPDSSS